jgi:hypothetical protein
LESVFWLQRVELPAHAYTQSVAKNGSNLRREEGNLNAQTPERRYKADLAYSIVGRRHSMYRKKNVKKYLEKGYNKEHKEAAGVKFTIPKFLILTLPKLTFTIYITPWL